MSLKRPIIKVTIECPNCKGAGGQKTYPDVMTGDTLNCDCSEWVECKRCRKVGKIDIKQKDPKFKKYYKILLEQQIDDLAIEYKNARIIASNLYQKLGKYCKELTKIEK